jgi:hypothetical protein
MIVFLQICHSLAVHCDGMPDWVVLTEQERATIKSSEDVYEEDTDEEDAGEEYQVHGSCWTCSHCTVYFDLWTIYGNVVDHLKSVYVLL